MEDIFESFKRRSFDPAEIRDKNGMNAEDRRRMLTVTSLEDDEVSDYYGFPEDQTAIINSERDAQRRVIQDSEVFQVLVAGLVEEPVTPLVDA